MSLRWPLALAILLVINSSVFAQEVGTATEEVLNKVSALEKPYAVTVKEEDCRILGIFKCLQPKVDFTHQTKVPRVSQVNDEGVGFWEQIGDFFAGLFKKSTDPNSGYGRTYLPNQYNPISEETDTAVLGLGPESDSEQTHVAIREANLPYYVLAQETPAPTRSPAISSAPSPGGGSPGPEPSPGGGNVPPANGNNAAAFARSLHETALRACGKAAGGSYQNSKTLAGTHGALPAGKDATYITCLQGKVDSEVFIDLKGSADGNSWLQCVGFVIGVEQSQGRILASNNAGIYCSRLPAGYTYINKSQMAPGDVVANTDGDVGHVMTVIDVGGNQYGEKITVAEANWGVSGGIGIRTTVTYDDIDCVLRRK